MRRLVYQIGCLTVLACLAFAGWLYRDHIHEAWHRWRGDRGEIWMSAAPGGLAAAQEKLRRLSQGGGPAWVDLTAADVAALVEDALGGLGGGRGRRRFDSVQVALFEGEVRVRGNLDLSGVPRDVLGPLESAIGERPPATIGGPLSVDGTGRLVLTVTYLKLRDFPFPRGTIARLLQASRLPDVEADRVRVPGAPRMGDVRVSSSRIRCYRMSPQ